MARYKDKEVETNQDKYTERKIYETTNYDQFIYLEENRPVTNNSVGKSIERKNLLKDNEILVTADLEVLDGQHRLEYAKLHGIPIYYKIADVTTKKDIGLLQIQSTWKMADHQHFYKDNENYQFVEKIHQKYGFSINQIVETCSQTRKSSSPFKDGTFQVVGDKEALERKYQKMHELYEVVKYVLKATGTKEYGITGKFFRSLWIFINRDGYDHDRLLHAFNKHHASLISLLCLNAQNLIIDGLENKLYNYHRRKNNHVHLED